LCISYTLTEVIILCIPRRRRKESGTFSVTGIASGTVEKRLGYRKQLYELKIVNMYSSTYHSREYLLSSCCNFARLLESGNITGFHKHNLSFVIPEANILEAELLN